jgi:TnpA family transposase
MYFNQFIHLYVEGSEDYADYRRQLLPAAECQKRLPEYCAATGLAADGAGLVASLKQQLTELAAEVDAGFPDNAELTIDKDGKPHLKQQKKLPPPDGFAAFERAVQERMPERHLLDILKNVQHWTGFTRHFGPPSGSDPKLREADRQYILTVFGYGSNLGASQTASHLAGAISRHTLRRLNFQHFTGPKLDAAKSDVIAEFLRFDVTGFWGDGKALIADGTHVETRENNLMGSQHIRYGRYGNIAYNHISNLYIALFCNFIACGVWEGVYILDAFFQNLAGLKPDTLHADTHGQSEAVFALAYLLGIKLMPRMRTWDDAIFYRPDAQTAYEHIDALFTETVDWQLIETHYPDMLQIALSIQAGLALPSMLLKRLGVNNKKHKLYQAFRELGRVVRTLFLLRYISEADLRRTIRAETTKVESYNDFLDWISFGGPVIKSGDPVEQAKRLKYMNLVANSIMLQNVADLTEVLNGMIAEGFVVIAAFISGLSPYMRRKLLRFGQYVLSDDVPEPLCPVPIQIAA